LAIDAPPGVTTLAGKPAFECLPDVRSTILSGANDDLSRLSTITYGLDVDSGDWTPHIVPGHGLSANTVRHHSRALQASTDQLGLIIPDGGLLASYNTGQLACASVLSGAHRKPALDSWKPIQHRDRRTCLRQFLLGTGSNIFVYNVSAHSNVAAQFSPWKSDAAGALSQA
jgi:hypothetical protein